jgi:hypothetical protein
MKTTKHSQASFYNRRRPENHWEPKPREDILIPDHFNPRPYIKKTVFSDYSQICEVGGPSSLQVSNIIGPVGS